jgi:hypothetical protein
VGGRLFVGSLLEAGYIILFLVHSLEHSWSKVDGVTALHGQQGVWREEYGTLVHRDDWVMRCSHDFAATVGFFYRR